MIILFIYIKESQTKRDLLGYLNLIPLFCNQLNIGSKVKENIIDVFINILNYFFQINLNLIIKILIAG